jgi:peptidoglycan/xylan/chitin deacetylase (PgdA/CDA1 family)
MQPNRERYPRARRQRRSGMTRRGLLGAAAVLAGAGIADLVHKNGHSAAPTPSAGTSGAEGQHAIPTSNEPRPVTSAGSHHHSPPHHAPGSGDSPPPSHHGSGGHHHHGQGSPSHPTARERKAERVDLPPAQVRVRSRPIYSVDELIKNPPKHAIALTVDDGPDPDWTPKVLRLLDKYRMQASFCVVGVHADAYPNLVRDVHRAGHVIVNHSYTHIQPFNRQTEKRVVAEITRTQRAIEKAAHVTPELFRAPGGAWSPFIFRAVAAYGLTPLDWDVDPDDWAMPGTRKIERAMLKGRPGDIVLCHDGGGNRSETVRALRKVLPAWKHRGYTTVPLVVPPSVKLPTSPTPTPTTTPIPAATTSGSASTSPSP